MVQCIFTGDSLHRVVDKHLLHQVDTLVRDLSAEFIELPASPLGEGGFEVLQFAYVLPQVLVWSSHHLEHLEDLIDLGVPTEEDFFVCNFVKDAAYRPNINRRVVHFCPKQYLRCSVPQCNNFMGVLLDRVVVSSGQSEICQLDVQLILTVDQYVLWLEVSVDDSVGVAELQCQQQLVNYLFYMGFG